MQHVAPFFAHSKAVSACALRQNQQAAAAAARSDREEEAALVGAAVLRAAAEGAAEAMRARERREAERHYRRVRGRPARPPLAPLPHSTSQTCDHGMPATACCRSASCPSAAGMSKGATLGSCILLTCLWRRRPASACRSHAGGSRPR